MDKDKHDIPPNQKLEAKNEVNINEIAAFGLERQISPQNIEAMERSEEEQESKEQDSQMTGKVSWTEEEDKKIFILYKQHGAKWSRIAKEFKDKTDNQVKNRFYSTLRRVATKNNRDNPCRSFSSDQLGKTELLQYVDEAFEYGHTCSSKRGRKKKKIIPNQSKLEFETPLPLTQPAIPQPMFGSGMDNFKYPSINLPNNILRPLPYPNFTPAYSYETLCDPSIINFQQLNSNARDTREEIIAKLYQLSTLQQNVINLLSAQNSFPQVGPTRASSSSTCLYNPNDK